MAMSSSATAEISAPTNPAEGFSLGRRVLILVMVVMGSTLYATTLLIASTDAATQIKTLTGDIERAVTAAGSATAESLMSSARDAQNALLASAGETSQHLKAVSGDIERAVSGSAASATEALQQSARNAQHALVAASSDASAAIIGASTEVSSVLIAASNEASTKVNNLLAQMEASYQLTSRLQKLSLANYLS